MGEGVSICRRSQSLLATNDMHAFTYFDGSTALLVDIVLCFYGLRGKTEQDDGGRGQR